MAFVRVTCRVPREGAHRRWSAADGRFVWSAPDAARYPVINGVLPSAADVEVTIVRDDGGEEILQGVSWLRYEAREGSEPNRLTMMLVDAELDVEAVVDPAMLVPQEPDPKPK